MLCFKIDQLKQTMAKQAMEILNVTNVVLGTSAPWTGQIIVTEEEPAGKTDNSS